MINTASQSDLNRSDDEMREETEEAEVEVDRRPLREIMKLPTDMTMQADCNLTGPVEPSQIIKSQLEEDQPTDGEMVLDLETSSIGS